jgi:hypothetical protein
LTKFLKDNFVLIVGLTLPILLMIGFIVVSSLPRALSDPPKHDLIFAVVDYSPPAMNPPMSLRLVVRDSVLKAQYTPVLGPNAANYGGAWKKLYRYEAGRQSVQQLTFGIPLHLGNITDTREETVEATAGLRLDTRVQAPDGYELTYGRSNRGGLLTDIFWSSSSSETRLRKGASSVRLTTGDGRTDFYAGNIEFIGWVVGTK